MWGVKRVVVMLGLCGVGLGGLSAHATPSSPETIARLVEALNYETDMERLSQANSLQEYLASIAKAKPFGAAATQLEAQSSQIAGMRARIAKVLPPEGVVEVEAVLLRFVKSMAHEFRWEVMKPLLEKSYGELFTEEEALMLVDFLASPTGRSAAEKLLKSSTYVAQTHGPFLTKSVEPVLHQFMTEMKSLESKYPQLNRPVKKKQ